MTCATVIALPTAASFGPGSDLLGGGSQTALSGTITNNGTITFASIGDPTSLFLGGDVTLAGSGTLTLDNTGLDLVGSLQFGDTLTIGVSQTIQGGGNLGDGQTNIVNNGTITANGSIPLQLIGGDGVTFTNNGVLQEIGTSQLQLVNNINVVGGALWPRSGVRFTAFSRPSPML